MGGKDSREGEGKIKGRRRGGFHTICTGGGEIWRGGGGGGGGGKRMKGRVEGRDGCERSKVLGCFDQIFPIWFEAVQSKKDGSKTDHLTN